MMKCIYEDMLNDYKFCLVACSYCTLEQKTNCKKKKVKEKKQTNFDRIKAMSVEELARFLAEHIDHYRAPYDVKEIYANAIDNKTGKGVIWIEAFKRWLESEVQGE